MANESNIDVEWELDTIRTEINDLRKEVDALKEELNAYSTNDYGMLFDTRITDTEEHKKWLEEQRSKLSGMSGA